MTEDPDPLACIFRSLQLLEHELESTAHVRVARIDVVEVVRVVPEVGIERDHA